MQEVWKKLSLGDLETILALERSSSIRELARRMEIPPSQVSRTVTKVERAFGVRLIERAVSGIVLTERGRQVTEQLTKAKEHLDSARLESTRAKGRLIAIGGSAFLNTLLMAPAVCSLQLPEAQWRLLDLAPDELVSKGIRGAFVLGIHISKLQWPRTWKTKKIGAVAWKLYASALHEIHSHRTQNKSNTIVSEEVVRKFPFVQPVYWTHSGLTFGNDFCPLRRERRLQGTAVSTADTALAVIRASDNLAFLPSIAAEPWVGLGHLKEITVADWPAVDRTVFLSAHGEGISKSLFEAIAQALGDLLKRKGEPRPSR